jgi:hypothetical protein
MRCCLVLAGCHTAYKHVCVSMTRARTHKHKQVEAFMPIASTGLSLRRAGMLSGMSIQTYIYTYKHKNAHTCIHACSHTYVHTYKPEYLHVSIYACMHACIYTYMYACCCIPAYLPTHPHILFYQLYTYRVAIL